ncbi:hypothetical protein OSTOST_01327 [Ostertagia ostertagi]
MFDRYLAESAVSIDERLLGKRMLRESNALSPGKTSGFKPVIREATSIISESQLTALAAHSFEKVSTSPRGPRARFCRRPIGYVVMPRDTSEEVTRENWSRRFSKTVFANLVPFRKTSDESKSPTTQLKARRRASAAPEVLLATSAAASPEISAVHKQRQRRRSADRIYALKSNQGSRSHPNKN